MKRLSIIVPAAALLVAAAACHTLRQPEWPLPPGVKTLPVNGYPMAYLERGSGPTLVLVPGSLNDYRYWMPQVETPSSRFRVVAVSLRHYFPERWNGEGTFSVEQHAQDVAVFIDVGPVYLVGWSRGGQIVIRTTLERPELVTKLVLMDAQIAELVQAMSSETPILGGVSSPRGRKSTSGKGTSRVGSSISSTASTARAPGRSCPKSSGSSVSITPGRSSVRPRT